MDDSSSSTNTTIPSLIHYLHYDEHRWHAGDIDVTHPSAERYVRVPTVLSPQYPGDYKWQTDGTTQIVLVDKNKKNPDSIRNKYKNIKNKNKNSDKNSTLFDLFDFFLNKS